MMKNKWLLYLLVFVLGVAQYFNTRNFDFAWDDVIVITENTRVQKGLSNIPELFENIRTSKVENRYGYRPITLLSFAAEIEFFGMDPKVSHRTNILLYGLLCMLVFFLLQTVFKNNTWPNLLIALLFVVHPLHTEVVANIKSRDVMLAMGFGLLSVLTYLRGSDGKGWYNYLLCLVFLVASFLSKENGIVYAGVLGLVTFYKHPFSAPKDWLRYVLPVAVGFTVLLLIRLFVFSDLFFQTDAQELADKGISFYDGFVGNPMLDLHSEPMLIWLNALHLNMLYVLKFFVPYPLVHDYAFNYLPVVGFADLQAWFAVAVFIGMMALLIKGLKERRIYGFGLAFYFITVSVYLQIAGMGPDIFAERYMFDPLLGLAIACVDGLFILAGKRKVWKQGVSVIILVVIPVFFSLAWNRNHVWKDNPTLLKTDLKRLRNGARINYNYALYLHRIYYQLPEKEKPAMQDSILHYYERTMEITDRLLPAYLDLGAAYMEFEKPEKAKNIFLKTIENYPQLSVPYIQMAKYHMTFAHYAEAIPYLEQAIEVGSKGSDYYYLLGICQFNTNEHLQAIRTLKKGEKLGMNDGSYLALMVRLHLKLNQMNEAKAALARGLAQFPKDAALLQMKAAVEARSVQ